MLIIRNKGSRSGSALVAATFVVVLVAGLSMCYLQITSSITRERKSAVDTKRAFYMAEAGLSEAVMALATGHSGAVGNGELPAAFADGLFWVESEDMGGGEILLKSTGLAGIGRYSLELVVDVNDETFPSLGAFGEEEVALGEFASVNQVDPTPDGLAPPPAAELGSNGNIVLGTGSSVDCDAVPGAEGSVQLGRGASVSGSSAPRGAEQVLPAINVPNLTSSGSLVVSAGQTVTIAAGDHRYDSLVVADGGQLVVEGPGRLHVGNLSVENGGTTALDGSNGLLSVYVTDSMELDSGANLSTASRDAQAVHLLVTVNNIDPGPPVYGPGPIPIIPPPPSPPPPATFDATGTFYGFIYAPDARVQIPSTLDVVGGVAARRLALGDGAVLTIDQDMLAAAQEESSRPEIVSWRTDDLPADNPLVRIRVDPFQMLEALNRTAKESDDAYDDAPPADGRNVNELLTIIKRIL